MRQKIAIFWYVSIVYSLDICEIGLVTKHSAKTFVERIYAFEKALIRKGRSNHCEASRVTSSDLNIDEEINFTSETGDKIQLSENLSLDSLNGKVEFSNEIVYIRNKILKPTAKILTSNFTHGSTNGMLSLKCNDHKFKSESHCHFSGLNQIVKENGEKITIFHEICLIKIQHLNMNTLVMKNNNVTMKWRYFDDVELASYEDEDTITIIAKFEDKEKIVQIDKVTSFQVQLFLYYFLFLLVEKTLCRKLGISISIL